AFLRTLEAHARALGGDGLAEAPLEIAADDDDDIDDDLRDAAEAAAAAAHTKKLALAADARVHVERMLALARRHRDAADAKVTALVAWIRTNMCPGAGLPDARRKELGWADKRLIIFTEYGDTKNYLLDQLQRALGHTDDGADR